MEEIWAILPNALNRYREFTVASKDVSLSVVREFEAKLESLDNEDPVFSGTTAVIKIQGMIRNSPSLFSYMYNGNIITYPMIARQIKVAADNDKVEKIQLQVDSVGGPWLGLFSVLDAIKSASKPIEAIVYGRADSAAYAIVSQADKISALNVAAEIGSIGLVRGFYVDKQFVTITSSAAPDKRPDVATEEGAAVVRAELDEMHEQLVSVIAEGRSAATGRRITEKTVNSNFGQGGTMLAEAGLAAGMIDEIQPAPARVSNAAFFKNSGPSSLGAGSIKNISNKNMDLNELKQQYPDVYGAAFAEGVAQERENATALLETGKACGKMDYAIKCVKEGKSISQPTVQATFLTARVNASDVDARGGENAPDVKSDASASADDDEEKKAAAEYLQSRRDRGLSDVKS
jgi:ClpP class serine protease